MRRRGLAANSPPGRPENLITANPGTNPTALYNFMVTLAEQGDKDYRAEYAAFTQALIADHTLVIEDNSVPLLILEKICLHKSEGVESFMRSHSIYDKDNGPADNANVLQNYFSTSAEAFADFISRMSNVNIGGDHTDLFQDLVASPAILSDISYVGNNGRLIPYFQEALNQYLDKIPYYENMGGIGLFFDRWEDSRAIIENANEKQQLLSAVYDADPAAFLLSYTGQAGNTGIVTKALHNIADLSLHSFTDKIKSSMIDHLWCTVTVVDSVIHNTYVNALQYQRLSLSSHHLYGSSRLGTRDYPGGQYYTLWDNTGPQPVKDTVTLNSRRPWYSSEYNDNISGLALSPYGMTDQSAYAVQHQIGNKQYELSNHLGNVQATVTDNRTFGIVEGDSVKMYKPVIAAAYDYYPFGMLMPDRYVSDTSAKCVTVTQSKWVTKKVLQCYNVPNWIWPGYIQWGSGKATPVQLPSDPDNAGILVEVNATGGVQFEFEVAADADNEFQLETAELSGSAATVSCFELIGGQQVPLGSFALAQSYQTIKVSVKPTTTKVYTSITGGTTGTAVKIKQICKWVPVMVQETILVDVCDGDKDRYRFGFNGQEKVNEWSGVGNHNTALFWEYDTRTGRRLNLDPKPTTGLTQYGTFNGNPIWNADVLGDTIIVDFRGYIIRNTGMDNLVYMENLYGKHHIGQLGGVINADYIFENLMMSNSAQASEMWNPFTFKNRVRNRGEWDYKSNMRTIYGIANHFYKNRITGAPLTKFRYGKDLYSASQLGNYHFGSVGGAFGFSENFMLKQAGDAQMKAGTSKPEWQKWNSYRVRSGGGFEERHELLPPYGDDPDDQKMIQAGFRFNENQKK